jgi:hypothetical protein
MKPEFKPALAAIVAAGLISSAAFASGQAPATRKHAAHKAAAAPSVSEQIQSLRDALDTQSRRIDSLQNNLAAKDAALKQAQESEAAARADAAKAQSALAGQQQILAGNAAAVASLDSAVQGLKDSQTALALTVSTDAAKVKSALESPAVLHYKGVLFTPSGFFNGESVWRSHATGADLPTPFNALPYEQSGTYGLSEMFISGRQSRIGLLTEARLPFGVARAYMEGDFLGVGTSSNNNQSNSYVFRQRVLMAELETRSGWTFSGGQGWSLATESKKGISTAVASIALPLQIDPNYVAGLVWSRGGNFRVTRTFSKAAFAISAENPQVLYTASLAGNTPYAVLGSAGVNAGLANAAMSSCSPSTSIVNYTNQVAGSTSVAIPVYKTTNACANLANISFNEAPDMLVKAAFDPRLGHYEVFGIARFAHEMVYPGETTNSNLYGNLKDIETGVAVAPALSTSGAFTNGITLGGLGASARVPLLLNRLTLGLKGLYGAGVGRYGDSTLSDVTANASGQLSPIHNLSAMTTVEMNPTPRLALYGYYGGDYAGREDYSTAATTTLAAPTAVFCPTGATTCTATPSAAQMAAGGAWGAHWAAPARAAVGYGSRFLSNTAFLTNAAPGFNGSSTGYYAGPSCGAQTRDVQEVTVGYWYDLFKSEKGRFRQGIQYSYAERLSWSGAAGIQAKGIENMFFTSFRYYLP